MSDFLRRFATEFAALDAGNLARLGELYSDDVLFRDPLHEVRGLPALQRYFAEMYANVGRLDFDFHGFDQVCDGEGYLRWTMRYRHPRLRGTGRTYARLVTKFNKFHICGARRCGGVMPSARSRHAGPGTCPCGPCS